jgi:hypothetical protein
MRLAALALCAACWLSGQVVWLDGGPTPTIEEILARVQTNTGQFARSLPDFVCDEKVTSKALRKGQAVETTVESRFMGRQEKSGRMTFTESREVRSVDGKEAGPREKLKGPFLFAGGFSSLLDLTFAANHVAHHTYKIVGEERVLGRPLLVVEFATRSGQDAMKILHYGKPVAASDKGKAWIDRESLQVVKIVREFGAGRGATAVTATVEYGEARIGERGFWMPLRVSAVQAAGTVAPKGVVNGEYVAVYRNYRKFDVTSGISFEGR